MAKNFWDESEEVESLIFGVSDKSAMRSLSREFFLDIAGTFRPGVTLPEMKD